MALIKQKELSTGQIVEYWKPHNWTSNWIEKKITSVCIVGYINEQARLDGKDFVGESAIHIPVDINIEPGDTVAMVYAKIKESNMVDDVETNWFADAVTLN